MPENAAVSEDSPRSARKLPWFSASVLTLLAALLAVGLGLAATGWQTAVLRLGVTVLTTAVAMLVGIMIAWLLDRDRLRLTHRGGWLTSKRWLDFWLPAVVGMVVLNGYVSGVTGRTAWFYLNLIVTKHAYRWTGSGGADANWALFVPVAVTMIAAMTVARLLHAVLRNRHISPVSLLILAVAGGVIWGSDQIVISRTASAAPVDLPTGWDRDRLDRDRLGRDRLGRDRLGLGDIAATRDRPDVVLLIFESLRADVLTAAVMPHAASVAAQGLSLDRHYAGSNSSLLGLYALLHGRPAAHADRDLKRQMEPAMLQAFDQLGYQTAFFCGGDPAGYAEMDQLLSPKHFDLYHAKAHDDWSAGDGWAVTRLHETLANRNRPPVMAVVFLMSTHFDYRTDSSGPFAPAAEDWSLLFPWPAGGSGQRQVINRYRNAAYAADALVGRVVQRLSLDQMILAITGDHGQALYDDGTVAHWSRLSEAQTRVPFVLAGNGISRRDVAQATTHADVAEMLVEAAAGKVSLPPARPILLVQSNPGMDHEDWAVIDGSQRTAWRRTGDSILYQGASGSSGTLDPVSSVAAIPQVLRLECGLSAAQRFADSRQFTPPRCIIMNSSLRRIQGFSLAILVAVFCPSLQVHGQSDSVASADKIDLVDVFVPGDDGYPAIRIPALVTTGQGTLLAFAEGRQGGDHSENDIILKRSTDGGQTWGELQVVNEQDALALNNPQPVVLDSGRVLLMYQRSRDGEHKAKPGFGADSYFTFTQYSDDDGQTWSDPVDVSQQVKRAVGVTSVASGPGIGIVLQHGKHAGRIILPMNQGPYGDWRVYATYSDDGGVTWQLGEVAPGDGKGHGNEVQMVELNDGRVMLNARTQGDGGTNHRKVAYSSDGGHTWTRLQDDPNLIEPVCQAAILRYSWPEDGQSRILFLNPNSKTKRENGTLRVSHDEGQTWPIQRVVYPNGFAYSCLTKMDDGRIGMLFERDGYKAISFAALSLDSVEDRQQ